MKVRVSGMVPVFEGLLSTESVELSVCGTIRGSMFGQYLSELIELIELEILRLKISSELIELIEF